MSKKYLYLLLGTVSITTMLAGLGCGSEVETLNDEPLTFEAPKTESIVTANAEEDLTLGEKESQEFIAAPLVYYAPFVYGYYDYYLAPVGYEIPISPWASLVDYVHPFYAYSYLNPYIGPFLVGDDDEY